MKTVILDGTMAGPLARTCGLAAEVVTAQLRAAGQPFIHLKLDTMDIGPCRGCFGCWQETPGRCLVRDDAERMLAALAPAELLILITPITWGGCSSELKKGMDRIIPLLLPFYACRRREVHLRGRYRVSRRLLAVGALPAADPEMEAAFHRLIWRNSRNLQVRWHEAVVLKDRSDLHWLEARLNSRLVAEEGAPS